MLSLQSCPYEIGNINWPSLAIEVSAVMRARYLCPLAIFRETTGDLFNSSRGERERSTVQANQ